MDSTKLDSMTNEDLQRQIKFFESNIRAMNSEKSHLIHENS
jgi:hypothetical protein